MKIFPSCPTHLLRCFLDRQNHLRQRLTVSKTNSLTTFLPESPLPSPPSGPCPGAPYPLVCGPCQGAGELPARADVAGPSELCSSWHSSPSLHASPPSGGRGEGGTQCRIKPSLQEVGQPAWRQLGRPGGLLNQPSLAYLLLFCTMISIPSSPGRPRPATEPRCSCSVLAHKRMSSK